MRTKITLAQQTLVEVWTAEGIGPAEQARRLELPVSRIAATRRKLMRAGLSPCTPRQPWKYWSAKETDKLIQLIEQGTSYPTIAKRLKRTETSIRLRCKRIGCLTTTTRATMSARAVADQLGISCSKVLSGWIRRGWLRGVNAGAHGRTLWRITWEDLTTFLENPAYWVAWRPDRIPEPALREWAQELRANEEPLLTQSQIAARFHVGRETVKQWIDKSWLPSVRYGNRRIPASALDGWVVPIDRKAPMSQEWPSDGWASVGSARGAVFTRRAA